MVFFALKQVCADIKTVLFIIFELYALNLIYILIYLQPFDSVSPHFKESHTGRISNSGPLLRLIRAAEPTTLESTKRLQILTNQT